MEMSALGDESLIIVMTAAATADEVDAVVRRLSDLGAEAHVSPGQVRTVIGAIGAGELVRQQPWEAFPGVERAVPILGPFRSVSRDVRSEDTVVEAGGVPFGGNRVTVIAGPCAVESREQMFAAAEAVRSAGAALLRGDAFKPRTSPYSFQGLGEKGLEILAEVRKEFGLPFVAEVLDPRDIDLVASYADMVRVGSRNMSNFTLLAELGRQPRPVMLKRGYNATIEEWMSAAEYVLGAGNAEVILCERGIRTFETATRNTLDISAIPVVRQLSHLPVVVDPSHSAGRRALVPALARASVAAGANGVMIDVHPAPEAAKVDGPQALPPEEFSSLMDQIGRIAQALGVEMAEPPGGQSP